MRNSTSKHQGLACRNTDQSPNWTINLNQLPDEVLLEIFDSYRQGIDPCGYHWRRDYAWFNLTHVCRRWSAVVFTSSSRLDLGITVGPQKPGHIEAILLGRLPIFVDYRCAYKEITGSALWRLRAALKHQDRIREITFEGTSAWFDEFYKATNCPFPVLESLVLYFQYEVNPKILDTFLRGPDPSGLHLRRLELHCVSLTSISGFLLSATTLTDLFLRLDTVFSALPETSLLACLQGMPCLRSLDLSISYCGGALKPPPQPWIPKDIVPLSKLTRFRYNGCSVFMNAFAGLSAPSLLDVDIQFIDTTWLPNLHLSMFINETETHYHAAYAAFQNHDFCISLLTQSEYIIHCEPHFKMGSLCHYRESMARMSSVLSTRLATVEELRVTLDWTIFHTWEDFFPACRGFYRQLPSVKALRTEGGNNHRIARTLLQDHEEPDDDLPFKFFPALEEIELGKDPLLTHETEHDRRELAAFQPFVSARQQAGRPVKIFFSP